MSPNCWFLLLLSLSSAIAQGINEDLNGPNCKFQGEVEFGLPMPVGNVEGDFRPSGLASSCQFIDILYFVNDNAGPNVIYAINAANAQVVGSINVTDATNVDWEDVATGQCPFGMGGCCIFINDAGSTGPGPDQTIYVIKEEENPATHVTKNADLIIKYKMQPGNEGVSSNSIFVDCEGKMFFFNMAPGGRGARIYNIQSINSEYIAVGVFQMDIPTTDNGPAAVSLSSDCCEMLIKVEDRVFHFPYNNGKIDKERLSILPCLPDPEGEAIAWSLSQDRYWLITENGKPGAEHMLSVAVRGLNVPDPIFDFGRNLGFMEQTDNVAGIAASHNHNGFLYTASDRAAASKDILIVQTCHAQTVGKIVADVPFDDVEDVAVGPCIGVLGTGSCLFLNDGGRFKPEGQPHKIYVFKEPENMYATTTVSLTEDNMISYTGASSQTDAIMVGCDGSIYVMDYVSAGEDFNIYKLVHTTGSNYQAMSIATIRNPSRMSGPRAADISRCCDEILIKFRDTVLLYTLVRDDVAAAFPGNPTLIPYIPEVKGTSITFSYDCKSYFTTSDERGPVALKQYNRLQCCANS